MLVSCTSGWAAGSARLLTRRGKEPSCRQDDHDGDSVCIEAAALPTAAGKGGMAMSMAATQSILLARIYIIYIYSCTGKFIANPGSTQKSSRQRVTTPFSLSIIRGRRPQAIAEEFGVVTLSYHQLLSVTVVSRYTFEADRDRCTYWDRDPSGVTVRTLALKA